MPFTTFQFLSIFSADLISSTQAVPAFKSKFPASGEDFLLQASITQPFLFNPIPKLICYWDGQFLLFFKA